MKKIKPRILVCSEASKVASGFGVYNKFLLEGLYNSKKYEVAEFASYGIIGDKEKHNIPWKYYPNAVSSSDPRFTELQSSVENSFGRWRFDKVLYDYKPHVVIDVRDYWMSAYQKNSPFRKYFHWILMPTIDSAPQQEEWLDTYLDADALFTYSSWGKKVLEQQTSNKIKIVDVASPCADFSVFDIDSNSDSYRRALNLPENATIIGTVMRNQKRKLFPELIKVLEDLYTKLESENIEQEVILYFHTSYPDQGWDFANLIKNSKLRQKIYFTYFCKNCGKVAASNFSGPQQICSSCGNRSCVLPSVANPIDAKILAKIMSVFYIYIQYSICEGFGMPQVEAGACGIPIITMNYSAMEDVIHNLNATPIKIGTFFKELETEAIRTYPDHSDCIEQLFRLVTLPSALRKRIGVNTANLVKEKCNWSDTINKWIDYIDTTDISGYEKKWNNKTENIIKNIDFDSLKKNQHVYDLIYSLVPEYLSKLNITMDNYWLLKNIHLAQNEYTVINGVVNPFSVKNVIDNINILINNHNRVETLKNHNTIIEEDFISYANSK